MADPNVGGTIAVDLLVSGSAALRDEAVRTARARTLVTDLPDRCRYGHAWCVGGGAEHGVCGSPLITCWTPGYDHPAAILDANITDFGSGPQISLSGGGRNGCEVTADQLRQVVADVRAHLPRLLALADQYDALTAGTVAQ